MDLVTCVVPNWGLLRQSVVSYWLVYLPSDGLTVETCTERVPSTVSLAYLRFSKST